MSLVFQYGSNTSVYRLNSKSRLDGAARIIGPAYTREKFDMDFTVWSKSNNCAAADIVPKGSTHIWGILYEIPDNRIFRKYSKGNRTLDQIEGEGGNYTRIKIEGIQNDKLFSALTYVVQNRRSGLMTSLDYASNIITGLRSQEIPSEYIEYVRQRIIRNNESLRNLLLNI